ncbi:MAG: hypothetical protein WC710_09315 [Gallionella sp.]
MSKFRNQAARNFKSAGWSAAKFTGRNADKAASGLFRWMVTDHSRVGISMPTGRGFFGTIWDLFMQLLIVSLGALVGGVLIFLVIAYGIPAFIVGHF